LIILRGVRDYEPYFRCRPDATGKLGFTSYQKCFAAIRILWYGVSGDIFDDYLRIVRASALNPCTGFAEP
jgi:hypothetical protein